MSNLGSHSWDGTEGNVNRTIHISGTFMFNGVGTSGSTTSGAALTLTSRKNTAAGNASISLSTLAGTFYDNAHTDHYSTGDSFNYQTAGLGSTAKFLFTKCVFAADNGHVGWACTASKSVWSNSTSFFPLGGGIQSQSSSISETLNQSLMRTAGTLKNAYINVITGSAGGSANIQSRKNGATGNINISIGLGATGAFEDATNSDTFVSGDKLCWTSTTGISGMGDYGLSSNLVYKALSSDIFSGTGTTSVSFSASDQFMPIVGCMSTPQTTEANVALQHGFSVTTTNFRINISANSMTGTTNFVVRRNSADGNQNLSVATGVTGTVEDTTHLDNFGPTDTAAYVIRNGTSGAITWTNIAITETVGTEHNQIIHRSRPGAWSWT